MIEPGDLAPTFDLPDQDGASVRLDALRGGWVLLYWYPKADTPGCTVQAKALRDQHQVFVDRRCTVLGASFDPVADLVAFRDRYDLPFALLSDPERVAGQAYGVAGDDGSASYASRVAFLIDPTGTIVHRYDVKDPEFFADEVLDDLSAAAD
ncbi:MAG: peroxiredoxin [Acidimicrobiales bacterium]|nr:peroxiredoxin [Acidimicrobiales bacterium]